MANTSKSRYPELYQFFAGYFYPGWISDYKWEGAEPSFKAVVRHFRAVNPPPVIESVRIQLDQLITSGSDEDLAKALSELGNGFDPGFEDLGESDWLKEIAEVLSESAAASIVLRERY